MDFTSPGVADSEGQQLAAMCNLRKSRSLDHFSKAPRRDYLCTHKLIRRYLQALLAVVIFNGSEGLV